jgi:hypothetical protein
MDIHSLCKRSKTIGALTLAMIVPSLVVFYQLLIGGAWYTLGSFVEVFHIYAFVYYYAIVLPIVASIIGISILRQRGRWARKASTVFQIVSVVIIILDSILVSMTFPMFNLVAKEYPKIISLILSATTLYLLLSKPVLISQE